MLELRRQLLKHKEQPTSPEVVLLSQQQFKPSMHFHVNIKVVDHRVYIPMSLVPKSKDPHIMIEL